MSKPTSPEVQNPTREEIAMGKVIDPFSEPYPLWHVTSFRNLGPIMGEGLVTEDFAKRIGKEGFSRRFSSSWNRKYISLRRGGPEGVQLLNSSRLAILVDPQDTIIEATEGHWNDGDPLHPTKREFLVKNRIAPREFKGLQIAQGINEPSSSYQVTVLSIVSLFQRLDPYRSLPIYGLDGLLWPIKMTREELAKRV